MVPASSVHIGLLSDTHSHWDDRMAHHLADCDEIWHAGDLGDLSVLDSMQALVPNPVRIVHGNIDNAQIRTETSEILCWEQAGMTILMLHIGGRPGRYAKGVRALLTHHRPDLFICGHSHLLRIERDESFGGLYCNPGAAGYHGFHRVRTLVKFRLSEGALHDVRVIELGERIKKISHL